MKNIDKTRSALAPCRNVLAGAVTIVLVTASSMALALEPFTAEYQANYMGMQGNGQMTLEPQGGNRWKYSLSIRAAAGDRIQSTLFEDRNGQFRPISNSEETRFLIKKKSVRGIYDWSTAQASWTGDVKPERAGPVKLQVGDLDTLLVNLATVRDILGAKPLSYRMVDNGRVKPMNFQVNGKEKVTVGGRVREATKATFTDKDKQIVVWVVPDVPVPVRILQREDGQDSIDLQIKSSH